MRAAQLGVSRRHLVVDGPRAPDDLAKATGADPRSLYRILRAAASVGVFVEDDEGRFGLTPMASCLRSDVDGSLRGLATVFTADVFWRPYGHLMHRVMTGRPAFDEVYGVNVYQYMRDHPDEARVFQEAAVGAYARSTGPVVAAYDFSRFGTVVDLGGGIVFLLAAILKAHPHLRGVLFEQPPVLDRARQVFADEGLDERVDLVGGDFFASVPPAPTRT